MKLNNRGFTLAEIMLVIAIMGILASVVIPRFTGRSQEARIQAAKLQIENIGSALDAFEYDCGRYPRTSEGLNALRQAPAGVSGWKGPYMKRSIPNDPWGGPYGYRFPGTSQSEYELWSVGADGQSGSSDDIRF
jgi:general secretion pathway protein G